MAAIMLLAAVPLMILNLLGGLVGFIGLAYLSEWRLIIGGIVWLMTGPFILSIALLPGMIFAPIVAWGLERGNMIVAVLAGAPSLMWTYIVVTIASVAIFLNIVARPDAGFFHLLWGYSMTTAPWSYMANKEKQSGNDASVTLMFFQQLGTVSMMAASWFDPSSMDFVTLLVWFFPFVVLGLIAQLFMAWVEMKNAQYRAY